MTIYYQDEHVAVHHGDCLEVLATLPDASVDAVVTDPPYGLGFMGREWDDRPPGEPWARECLRVLKPGGHLLAFGGTRTWHRLACAVEDAGFEIRDSIAWVYGSGFPKSRNLDGEWEGWGTALKPAFEPIVVGRKPLAGTVAVNVQLHGTGALNIDGCRVPMSEADAEEINTMGGFGRAGAYYDKTNAAAHFLQGTPIRTGAKAHETGRWPANVVLDESQAAALDEQSGERPAGGKVTGNQTAQTGDSGIYGRFGAAENRPYGDTGGASRFFPTFRYEAKAPSSERPRVDGIAHPTVKPLALMQWLVRLVTPPGGVVLEPFAGSGATAEACVTEGFRCIAIEREADYLPLIRQRLDKPIQISLFGETA